MANRMQKASRKDLIKSYYELMALLSYNYDIKVEGEKNFGIK